jgi:FkbM family methyltransferase
LQQARTLEKPSRRFNSVTYRYHERRLPFLMKVLKSRLFSYCTRKSSPLFLKGGDDISTSPLVSGGYENELTKLLQSFAAAGLDETLIDIGANVGLTSYYARSFFKSVYCFEPNPRVFLILKANLYSFLTEGVKIFNFGLGEKNERVTLTVPKTNFGGAFIQNDANAYSLDELASKDGYKNFDSANYDEIEIELRSGRTELSKIFAACKKGVTIKIDVEGFEQTILTEIAAALPPNLPFVILFENWSNNFDPVAFARRHFQRPMQVLKMSSSIETRSGPSRKMFDLAFRGRHYKLTDNPAHWVGMIAYVDNSVAIVE